MRIIFALVSIVVILLISACGEDEITADDATEEEVPRLEDNTEEVEEVEPEEEKPVETGIPRAIEGIMDELIQGMEEEDIELYLDAFWADDYSYHSDSATDDPWDDVMFDDVEEERGSIQGLFAKYDDFSIEFRMEEFTEIDAAEAELRGHYRMVASVERGMALPGGYLKVFAEGENIFTLKKRNGRWRISHWKQEEMSKEEIERECVEENICPPEGVLPHAWGVLKVMF